MGNLADYFDKVTYKSKYTIGDRVFGKWNKIPFIGSVGNDSCPDGVTPRVSVHLDLPIKHKDKVYNILFVEHKDIKSYLVNYDTSSSKKSS
jgi:hypothetical protein